MQIYGRRENSCKTRKGGGQTVEAGTVARVLKGFRLLRWRGSGAEGNEDCAEGGRPLAGRREN